MEHFQHSVSKVLKKTKKFLKKLKSSRLRSPLIFLISGLLLLFFGGFNYYRLRILSFTSTPTESTLAQKGELPERITIPSIGIDLPVEVGEIKDGVWQISGDSATFLSTSVRPGGAGNIVIYGHNKKVIFGNLPYLSLGQKIYVKTVDGKIHIYEAYWKDFVGADRVDLVSVTSKEELTIFTCWGLFDQNRAVIKAKPVK